MTKLGELTLRHVDPTELLFQLRHPALSKQKPSWYNDTDPAGLAFTAWQGGAVLALMHAQAEKPAYFVRVVVLGLFMSDEQVAAQAAKRTTDVDESILKGVSDDEMQAFIERVATDLYPFVRSELYSLSSRVQAVPGVMLEANVNLNG